MGEEREVKEGISLEEAKAKIGAWKFVAEKCPRWGDEELCKGRAQAYGNVLDILAQVEILADNAVEPVDGIPH